MIVESELVEKLPNGALRCKACSWRCLIPEGRHGFCGPRWNRGGKLDLIVYGKPSAVQIDPVEKKPLFHFLPGEKAFSIGTYGCNFKCLYCQNWTLSQAYREGLDTSFHFDLPPQKAVSLAESYGAKIIAYTYNEPIIFYEYARDIGMLAKERGIKNVFVTSGYETEEAWKSLRKFLDAANIDLKAFSDSFYKKYTGTRLEPVLNSIKTAKRLGIWVEVTTLLIPGLNDSEEELREAAKFLKSIDREMPWHLTAFHPDYKLTDVPPTTLEKLLWARSIAVEEGLKYVYIGNVPSEYESTYCPNCGTLLIKRDIFKVEITKDFDVEKGACRKCGQRIKGVWKS